MELGLAGKIAIAILLILLLIWIVHTTYKTGYMPEGAFRDSYESMVIGANRQYDKYFTSPTRMYTKTTGYDYDDAAKIAIDKATRLEAAHTANEASGLSNTAAEAATNAFILGDLYRYNVATGTENDEARHHALDTAEIYYRRALHRINRYAPNIIQQPIRDEIAPEVMLERIAEFYDTNQLEQQVIHDEIQTALDEVRDARVTATRNNKKKKSKPGRGGARDAYYEIRPIHNDPQNVHDSVVTQGDKIKFALIRKLNQEETGLLDVKSTPTIQDIERALNASSLSQQQKLQAADVLTTMALNGGSYISSIGATESQIVLEIWKRIHSAVNHNNRTSLANSFFESLASGIETRYDGAHSKVCSTGRSSRVLSSLTVLDASEEVAKPTKTTDILRNEILAKAYTIFQNELLKAPGPIQTAYNDPNATDSEELTQFKGATKKLIEDVLREDYKDTKPTTLDNFIKDAQAGVDI